MVSNLLISPTPKFGPSSKRVTKELTPISIHYSSNELLFSSIELNHFICWIKLLILKLILSSKMNNNKESKLSHQTTRRETNHFQLSCKGCFMLNFIPTIDKNPFMLMYKPHSFYTLEIVVVLLYVSISSPPSSFPSFEMGWRQITNNWKTVQHHHILQGDIFHPRDTKRYLF